MENFTFDFAELSKQITSYAPRAIGAIVTLIIGFWIANKMTGLVRSIISKNRIDPTLTPFLSSLVNVGIKVMVLLAVAGMFGIETTSFIAIFSALAFAIGLALQGSLGHFASGVMLLVFRPYKVGDLVEIGGGKAGEVMEIQIFNTVLATLDNKRIIVPNGVVTSNIITNISGQGTIGVELNYRIAGATDIDKARAIILEVGKSCPYILTEPAQGVVVAGMDDDGINLASRPFCKSEHYWDTLFYMNEHVKKALGNASVTAPARHMEIQMFNKN